MLLEDPSAHAQGQAQVKGEISLWELLLSMLTKVLLGLTAAGAVRSHTCAAASIKQGTYIYKQTHLEELEKRNPLITCNITLCLEEGPPQPTVAAPCPGSQAKINTEVPPALPLSLGDTFSELLPSFCK